MLTDPRPAAVPAEARRLNRCRSSARRRALLALGLMAIPVLAACGDDDATASGVGLTRDEFIEVVVELRDAERISLETDSAAEVFGRRKAEVLARHGTSEEEIRAFAEAATRDLPAFTALWEEISNRLRRPVVPDSL